MMDLTQAQQAVLAKLEAKGFRVDRQDQFDGDDAPTVFLSKRVKLGRRYVEIGPDGSLNGKQGADIDAEIRALCSTYPGSK